MMRRKRGRQLSRLVEEKDTLPEIHEDNGMIGRTADAGEERIGRSDRSAGDAANERAVFREEDSPA